MTRVSYGSHKSAPIGEMFIGLYTKGEVKATTDLFRGSGVVDFVVEDAVMNLSIGDADCGFTSGYRFLRDFGFRLPENLHSYWVERLSGYGEDEAYAHWDTHRLLLEDGPAPVAA